MRMFLMRPLLTDWSVCVQFAEPLRAAGLEGRGAGALAAGPRQLPVLSNPENADPKKPCPPHEGMCQCLPNGVRQALRHLTPLACTSREGLNRVCSPV